jgi:fatty acid desaturase
MIKHAEIIRRVIWKDLIHLSPKEIWIENSLTLPWLLGSWVLAYYEYYLLAMPFSAFFYLTALRQVHNGFHYSLGIGKRLTWWNLYINSLLMMASAHAIKFNHLRHHQFCLKEEDYEGKSAKMTWWGAILYGPKHFYLIHQVALKHGGKPYQKWVLLEVFSILVFSAIILFVDIQFLIYHFAAMMAGEMLSAFFAVWAVHHDCDEETIARTQRKGWKNFLTYNMFYHLEHHLFPAVPTIKLPELAKRIDAVLPELEKKNTF